MYRIKHLVPILLFLGYTQMIGCGQTEYTGALKERYQACQLSQGFEYHPEEGQCYCTNGIVCEEGYVCDTAFNDCIKHVHEGGYDCENLTLKYTYDSVSDEMVMKGECEEGNLIKKPEIPEDENECALNANCSDDKEDALDDPGAAPEPSPKVPDGTDTYPVILQNYDCSGPSLHDTQLKCTEGVLSYNYNGEIKTISCEKGCDGNVCIQFSVSEGDTCSGNETICITNNNQGLQYRCQNNKWKNTGSSSDGCDVSQKYSIDLDPMLKGKNIQYYLEVTENNTSNYILITLPCNSSKDDVYCKGKDCVCHDCEPGKAQCNNFYIEKCNQYGVWERTECCEFGCTDNNSGSVECKKECEGNNQKCENNQMYNCVDGSWTESTPCPNGCNEDGTKCNQDEEKCDNGTKKCEGNQLSKCEKNQWTPSEECPNGCDPDGKTCVQEELCKPNSTKCKIDMLYNCVEGQWKEGQKCPSVCNKDGLTCAQEEKTCESGLTKCENNVSYNCVEGQWKEEQKCPSVCNKDGLTCAQEEKACEPGLTKCESKVLYNCVEKKWEKVKECTNGCNKDNTKCN